MSDVRMIATDIDGTMLRSDGRLDPVVKRALNDAVAAGITVVPATGRPVMIAADVIEAAQLPHYWVFANGAITRHLGRDELIRGFWIDHDLARSMVVDLRSALPSAGFAIEFEREVAYEDRFDLVVPSVPDVPVSVDVVAAIDNRPNALIQKILVFDLGLDLDELFRRVNTVAAGRAVASYSGLPFIELAADEVTKAVALDLLARDLGITPAQVVAFGDNHNDISMLEWAGTGYAMANATDDAKEAADEVIASNDDNGLARKIHDLIG